MLADACHAVERGYALHDAPSSSDPESSRALFAEAQAQALKLIDGCEEEVGAAESPALQALLWCLRGKAMTLGEEGRGSLEAEVLLADAVKLDPSLIDAWNCLGECFWHRNELETARCTFVCALEHERSADTLRLLSMLLRTMARSGHEGPASLLAESVHLAKESVRRDAGAAKCWLGLGCAHLVSYLDVTQTAEELHLAHKALSQASRAAAAAATTTTTDTTDAAATTTAAAPTATGEGSPVGGGAPVGEVGGGGGDGGAGGGAGGRGGVVSPLLLHEDVDVHLNYANVRRDPLTPTPRTRTRTPYPLPPNP